jgi:hypothetical protein
MVGSSQGSYLVHVNDAKVSVQITRTGLFATRTLLLFSMMECERVPSAPACPPPL